jgi:triacylglycerol lipase
VISLPPSVPFHRDRLPAAVPIWREALVGLEWLALRASPVFYGLGVPPGDGSAVVVVPGFLGSDVYLQELYWWLRRIGYQAYMSRIGRNAECLDIVADRLLETIDRAQAATGGKVHLIGHSLGGMLSRSAAARRPERIASVTTLGSPFRGIRSHPFVMQAADRVRSRIQRERGLDERSDCYTGYCNCDAVAGLAATFPPSVPQMNIYTKTDGIVDWRFCLSGNPESDFEVPGTHVGLVFNPCVYSLLAARLGAARAETPAREVAS